METKLIEKAKLFATKAHKHQFRKDDITPYIVHPEAVANLLINIGITSENIIASAWLHDVIEDCQISKEIIKEEFNSKIAERVQLLTKDCSQEEYNKRILQGKFAIQIIKLADMIHNCSDLFNVSLPAKLRKRKISEAKLLYLKLAKKTYKPFYYILKESIKVKGGTNK